MQELLYKTTLRCMRLVLASLLSLLLVPLSYGLGGQTQSGPDGVRVSAPGEGITIKAKEPYLYPEEGSSFFLSVALKFHHFPASGDRIFILKNFGRDGAGYALAIDSDGKEFRPVVYWSDAGKKGRWYSFATIELKEKEWTRFIIHYSRENVLGLHLAQEDSLTSLGGYGFKDAVVPQPDRSLVVGAIGTASFRGRIGDLHVYRLPGDMDVSTMIHWLAGQSERSLVLAAEDHLLGFDGASKDTSIHRRPIDIHIEERDEKAKRKRGRKQSASTKEESEDS